MAKGIVFDMDGVLIDTEKLYMRFWCEAANYYGYPMEKKHVLSIRSLSRPYAIKKLQNFFGVDFNYDAVHSKRIELMDKYIAENSIEMKNGADIALKYFKDNNYKTAVATATPLKRAEKYLSNLNLLQYFDKIVSAHDVKRGKPQPDIYLKACELLRLSPCDCIAVEDSPNGALAAFRAGCKTVIIPDLDTPDEETRKFLSGIVENLIELTEFSKKF